MQPPTTPPPNPSAPARAASWLGTRSRPVQIGLGCAVLIVLCICGTIVFAVANIGTPSTANTAPHSTGPLVERPDDPTPTPTPTPPLTPVAGLLDAPPTQCPLSPPLDVLNFSQFGGFVGSVQFVGHAPVWIPQPYLGRGTTPITIDFEQNGYTPFPHTKIVWEVGPDYTHPVSVQLLDLRTGAPAWWVLDATHYMQTFVLDPAATSVHDHGSPELGWHEWGSGVYIGEAGCYALDVTWPGGSWRTIIAAGR
jgi:hypothetical protein